MKTVKISKYSDVGDEYFLHLFDNKKDFKGCEDVVIEVTDEFYERYEKIFDAFYSMQEELGLLYNAQINK